MSMKFHIKAASDILSKGLDPSHPYNVLGNDGMLALPSTPEEVPTSAVVSVSAPVVEEPPVPETTTTVEPIQEETQAEETVKEPVTEVVAETPVVPAEVEAKTPAKVGRAKAAKSA